MDRVLELLVKLFVHDFPSSQAGMYSGYLIFGHCQRLKGNRHSVNGSPIRVELNVDGFSLIHNEFFDHLFLLHGVQLQKNNPGKETRTGDGVNYTVDYTYTYDSRNAPLTKKGDLLMLNGATGGTALRNKFDIFLLLVCITLPMVSNHRIAKWRTIILK